MYKYLLISIYNIYKKFVLNPLELVVEIICNVREAADHGCNVLEAALILLIRPGQHGAREWPRKRNSFYFRGVKALVVEPLKKEIFLRLLLLVGIIFLVGRTDWKPSAPDQTSGLFCKAKVRSAVNQQPEDWFTWFLKTLTIHSKQTCSLHRLGFTFFVKMCFFAKFCYDLRNFVLFENRLVIFLWRKFLVSFWNPIIVNQTMPIVGKKI